MTTLSRHLDTIATSFVVLDVMNERDSIRLSEVAEGLDLAKSTVHAHLSTLHDHEYVPYLAPLRIIQINFLSVD